MPEHDTSHAGWESRSDHGVNGDGHLGDQHVRRQKAKVFLDECPECLRRVRFSIEGKQDAALADALEALRHCVMQFSDCDASGVLAKLSQLENAADWNSRQAALRRLEREVESLESAVAALALVPTSE